MRRYRSVVLLALVSTLFGALGLFVVVTVIDRTDSNADRAQTAEKRAVRADKRAVVAKAKTDKVARKVDRQVIKLDRTITVLGKAGVDGLPGRTGSKGPPGIAGVQGPPGPRGRDAVFPFTLQDLADRLPPAIEGPAGQDVTDAQALRALTTYCEARGDCRGLQGDAGAQGPPGVQGEPGAASTVPGPQGEPGPTVPCASLDPALGYVCAP